MKIRGNVVGTTLKPDKTLVKATNLTEEEKAQARDNIGAAAESVYVGSDTPPDMATVWIDPRGEPTCTEDWEFDMDDGTTEIRTVVVVS